MIDWHTHVFPPRVAPRLTAAIGREFGHAPAGSGTVTDLDHHLNRAGLTRAVCFTAALKPDQMIPANSWMISLRSMSPRLIPLGTVHPGHSAWESELDRLESHGIRGIKIHPDLTGIPLDSPQWQPVWKRCQGKLLVMLHMGPAHLGHASLSRPRDLARILDAYPELLVIAAHLGGLYQWSEALDLLVGRDLYLDTSCCPGVIPTDQLDRILARHDDTRILFGSDYPLFAPMEAQALWSKAVAECGREPERFFMTGQNLAEWLDNGDPACPPDRDQH